MKVLFFALYALFGSCFITSKNNVCFSTNIEYTKTISQKHLPPLEHHKKNKQKTQQSKKKIATTNGVSKGVASIIVGVVCLALGIGLLFLALGNPAYAIVFYIAMGVAFFAGLYSIIYGIIKKVQEGKTAPDERKSNPSKKDEIIRKPSIRDLKW